jgi:bacterioferritin-associated ferredoxin
MEYKKVHVAMCGRDEITIAPCIQGTEFSWIGCSIFCEIVQQWASNQNSKDPREWTLPRGLDHASLLLKEALLRYRGDWSPPYSEEDICHCRRVTTRRVYDAILNGDHSLDTLRRTTSAGTSCGSCRRDLVALLDYCLVETK